MRDGIDLADDGEALAPLFDAPPPRLRLLTITFVEADRRPELLARFARSRLAERGATLDLDVPTATAPSGRYDDIAE